MRPARYTALLAVLCPALLLGAAPSLGIGLAADPSGAQAPVLGHQPAGAGVSNAGDATLMNARSFHIPFGVRAAGAEPVEVQLYVRRGADASWTLAGRQPPSAEEFQFTAEADGDYWFATRTVDAQGRAYPTGPIEPGLKVVVDTTGPRIDLSAEADASGRVEATIEVRDDQQRVADLQIRYATDTERRWEGVDLSALAGDGRLSFTPGGAWDQLSLYVAATDSAGNQSTAQKLLQRPRVADADDANLASSPAAAAPSAKPAGYRSGFGPARLGPRLAAAGPHPMTGSPQEPDSTIGRYRGAAAGSPASPRVGQLPPPATPEQVTHGFGLNAPAQNAPAGSEPSATPGAKANAPKPRPRTPAEAMRPLKSSTTAPANTPRSEPQSPQPQSNAAPQSDAGPQWSAPPRGGIPQQDAPAERFRRSPQADRESVESAPEPAPQAAADERSEPDQSAPRDIGDGPFALLDVPEVIDRAPLRFSDSNRFSLDYELESVGTGGVEAVELWGTLDGGQTWKRWGSDPDRASPFDIETNGEGVFGFRIVVVGENGLASPRPLAGESPDIFIAVDQGAPQVRIRSARYGEGSRTGSLVIHYECADPNLESRPISLSFSDRPDGPWTTIAAGLENDGDHVWPADPQLPRQLYLRIDASDRAGNVGTYVLDRPIGTQGLAPRARIRGFQSAGGSAERPSRLGEKTAARTGSSERK